MDKEMGLLLSACIVDTNILIYHLAGVLTDQAEANLAGALESGLPSPSSPVSSCLGGGSILQIP